MNRRNFISKSSLALLAAAGLPKAVFSKTNSLTIYKTKLLEGIVDQTCYELQIDHLGFSYMATATEQEKKFVLKVSHYDTTDLTKPDKAAELNYIVETANVETIAGVSVWTIQAKLESQVSGDTKIAKQFPKELKLTGVKYSYFKVYGKKDKVLADMPYYVEPSSGSSYDDYDGCFLTTACVGHKQLADDCDELTTLRFLRDAYMKQNTEGALLVTNYKIIGPKIVKTINNFDNKAEVYNYMYDHLIVPSVKLIKEKKYAEATSYYKDFVEGLTKQYL